MHTYIVYHHVNLDGGVKGTYVSMTESLLGKGQRGQRPISIMPLLSSFFFNRSLDATQAQEIAAVSKDRMLGVEVCRRPGMAAAMARHTGCSATA
jgi:hypothetical protein